MRNLLHCTGLLTTMSVLLLTPFPNASAQDVLSAWNTNGNPSSVVPDGWPATTTFANMEVGELSRGSGVVAIGLTNGFAANTWNSAVFDENKYFEFFAEPSFGYQMELTEVRFRTRRSSTGPTKLQLAYSLDGVNFTNVGPEIDYAGTTDGFAQPPIDLSGEMALQAAVARVTFRLYGWGASGSSGTFSFGRTGPGTDDLVVEGFVAPVAPSSNPEPENHVTGFACGEESPASSSIGLSWVDATGTDLPSAYLVRWSDIDFASIPDPVDGTPVANGSDAQNIIFGAQQLTVGGLDAETTYYFKIFPYSNNGAEIDYKTDGIVPEVSCTTTELIAICGNESFELMPANNTSYTTRTWVGDDGYTYTATNARTDQSINGRAILMRQAGTLSADEILNGIGSITLTTQRLFTGGSGTLDVSVNGVSVGTIPYSNNVETTTISGIDVEGTFDLAITTPANSDRIALDDLTWTCFGEPTVFDDEPSEHATSFTCGEGVPEFSEITLTWVDGAGTDLAAGYLIRWSDVDFASILDPVDGTVVADGANALNVEAGVQTASIAGLSPETVYFFKIFPYSNSAAAIDYKTDGMVPEVSCETAAPYCRFETFENMPTASGSYTDFTFTGDNGFDFTATDARTDQTLNGRAILIRDGSLSANSVAGGADNFTITTRRVFSGGSGVLTITINGDVVGTAPYNDQITTTTLTGLNITDPVNVLIETPGNGDRIQIDNLGWTSPDPLFDCEDDPFAVVEGCTNPTADNYNELANTDDGSCIISGCTDPLALNYNEEANNDNGSCYTTLPNIVINEVHYNPCGLQGPDADFEFVELYNADVVAVNLSGWVLSGSINFTFPAGATIDADEYILVAINAASYLGNGYQVFEWTSGQLGNNSGNVTLSDGVGNIAGVVPYLPGSPWPAAANGDCSSLELIDPSLDPSDPLNWQASFVINGTPGAMNSQNIQGCTTPGACNYDQTAISDDGSCDFVSCFGCIYENAANYSETATIDDGSCDFDVVLECPGDLNEDGVINASDLGLFLTVFGTICN